MVNIFTNWHHNCFFKQNAVTRLLLLKVIESAENSFALCNIEETMSFLA